MRIDRWSGICPITQRLWTEEETANLRKWVAEKVPTEEICNRLDRTRHSITGKCALIGITVTEDKPKYKKPVVYKPEGRKSVPKVTGSTLPPLDSEKDKT